jgi:hypothetical protein
MVKKSAVKNPKPMAIRKPLENLPVLLETHNKQETNSVVPSTEDWPLRPVIEISGAAIRNRLEFFSTLENNVKQRSAKSNIK